MGLRRRKGWRRKDDHVMLPWGAARGEAQEWCGTGFGTRPTPALNYTALSPVSHSCTVLIVSTDPAHNLSDAFGQKFGRTPTLVEGFANLYCMEIDPSVEVDDAPDLGQAGGAEMGMVAGFMKEFSTSIPVRSLQTHPLVWCKPLCLLPPLQGIDELMSFAELMKHVQSLSYDVTVFDTAPTGHTLRLLSLPGTSAYRSVLVGVGVIRGVRRTRLCAPPISW